MFRKEWCFLLADALKDNHSITELALGTVKPSSCKHFAELLKINKTIKILNFLDGSSIEDKGLIVLTDIIENNTTLTSLILQGNQIENEGCTRLCNALKKNTSITHLDLSYNTLEYDAWKSIGDMLKINSTLKILELNECGFKSEDGCVALVEALKINSTLTELNILRNGFNRNSTNSLVELVQTNKSITSLSMASDLFEDPQIARQLKEALITNTTIRNLNMSLCPLIYEGTFAISEVLQKNQTITALDLSNNAIGSWLTLITKALENNTTLTHLNIKSNSISSHGGLIDLLRNNFSLNSIDFSPTAFDEGDSVKQNIVKSLKRNARMQYNQNLNLILAIWSICRRSESRDLFPSEIWLHIFKFIRVSGYCHIHYDKIFENLSLAPVREEDRAAIFKRVCATIHQLVKRSIT